MAIQFRCAQCNKLLQTGDETAGRRVKCPECGAVLTVPQQSTAAPPPSAPGGQDPFAPRAAVNPYQSPAALAPGPSAAPAVAGELVPTPIDLNDVFARTWEIFKQQFGLCILAGLVVAAAGAAVVIVAYGLVIATASATQSRGLAGIMAMLALPAAVLAITWIQMGALGVFLKIARGQPTSVGEIFSGGPQYWSFLGATVLVQLAVGFGMLFCYVPGIILALMFSQYAFLIIDRNVPAVDSLSLSNRITRASKLMLFVVWLLASLVGGAVAMITCGIGYLAVIPFIMLLSAVIYLRITGQATAGAPAGYPAPAGPQPMRM
jgi:phage FluMu protein Com